MRGSEDERERSDMVDPREETPGLSDHTEFTETRDPSTTQHVHGSTLGTDPLGMAARREGLKAVFGDTGCTRRLQGGAKRLQKSLDAIWPNGTPAHGGDLFGPPSTTPPGNSQHRQQNPGAPVQNRMLGETAGGERGGAAQAQQYTAPQPPSAGSTQGSQLAICRWGGPQDGRQDRCRTRL
jgi:hypothetical protein